MARLAKILLFAAGVPGAIYAQTASPPPLAPAMQSAIHRIIHGTPNPPPIQLTGSPAAGLCSVPLLEMRVEHPERFAIKSAPAPRSGDAIPSVKGPAPSCKAVQSAQRP